MRPIIRSGKPFAGSPNSPGGAAGTGEPSTRYHEKLAACAAGASPEPDSADRVPALPLQIVVMAAGQGKRMRSARPKALHPLAGRPLVAHALDTVRTLAPRALVVVVGHGGDEVRAALGAQDLAFVTQDPPRGTGDAVRIALGALGDDAVTLVANGDCPLIAAETYAALAEVAGAGRLALLTARVADPSGLGRVVRGADGTVRAIVEESDATAEERAIDEIYTGALAAPTALLRRLVAALKDDNVQHEYYLTDIVAIAVAAGVPVEAHLAADPGAALGVNDRAQLAAIERLVQARLAGALMETGTSIVDPARIDIRGTLRCGRDVTIDVGCVFEGEVSLADDVRVGAYCVLRNVSVGPRTELFPFCHFDGATIGAGCRVGPFARMRPGATLDEEVHLGNFVEVKASRVGAGAKANHLAYIGDATVGARTNIGAGAIVANYDGANKHPTVIGDGVFIGSNCVLVAPITVGSGATIAAGSTITDDAPPNELTVARARQVQVTGWKRPVKKVQKPVKADGALGRRPRNER
jgi:bifunctional UDP-N-acetylglucosamine pyrophosphorylase/glucosamine-1-phosphate N-acetyltransferase